MKTSQKVKLGDICTIRTGKLDSNAAVEGGKYPFFTCAQETFSIDKFAFDTEAVLLGGNNANGIFPLKYYQGKFNAYQRTYIIESMDKEKVLNKFIYFSLRPVLAYFKSASIGATTQFLTKPILDNLKINLPEIHNQKYIVDLLFTYDDLIDNNRKRIQLLEESARLLFREWFVYFRFPGHEKVKIIDGVPEGWVKGTVGNLAKVKSGYAYNSKDWLDEGDPVVKIGNIIGDGTVNLDDCSYIDENVASKTKDFALIDGDLLIAMTGATVGKVGLFSGNTKTAYLNQRVGKFTPKFKGAELVLYCFFMSDIAQNHITNYAGGAAQPNISASQIESIKMIVSTKDVYTQFISFIKPMFEEILKLRKQNQKLAQARDLLLPRLMNGTIQV